MTPAMYRRIGELQALQASNTEINKKREVGL